MRYSFIVNQYIENKLVMQLGNLLNEVKDKVKTQYLFLTHHIQIQILHYLFNTELNIKIKYQGIKDKLTSKTVCDLAL